MEYEELGVEIHVKIGGDHGGESFKMSFQVNIIEFFYVDIKQFEI